MRMSDRTLPSRKGRTILFGTTDRKCSLYDFCEYSEISDNPAEPIMPSGRFPGATRMYRKSPTAAAENVVSTVYLSAVRKIRPESLCDPSVASVVITASTMVGTASSWKRRVYTLAMKFITSSIQPMASIPKATPITNAPIHNTIWRCCPLADLLFVVISISLLLRK